MDEQEKNSEEAATPAGSGGETDAPGEGLDATFVGPDDAPSDEATFVGPDEDPPGAATAEARSQVADSADIRALWHDSVAAAADGNMEATLTSTADMPNAPSRIAIKARQVRDRNERARETPDYEKLSVLGEGGMGVVLSARQTALDRPIALKMMKPNIRTKRDVEGKFLAEAAVTADLEHPNIVPIYDLGANQEGALFYAMKSVKGDAWIDVIADMDLDANLETLMRVADAIAFAHSRGVIHRDLKPDNVMLGDFGEVLVMDWGLAAGVTPTSKAASLGEFGRVAGTPAYMAPEMAQGDLERIGFHSDTYLLGAILYRIITGVPPHTGADIMQCLQAAAANEIQWTDRSGELMDIANKAMRTEPEKRYGSVKEFQAALHDYQKHYESIELAKQSKETLKKAQETKDYNDFARAMFGYEQCLTLWKKNKIARVGVRTSRLAYAECAFEKSDLDLAAGLLEEAKMTSHELYKQVEKARRKRDAAEKRMKVAKRVAAGAIKAQSDQAEQTRQLTQKYRRVALGLGGLVLLLLAALVVTWVAFVPGRSRSADADFPPRQMPPPAGGETQRTSPAPEAADGAAGSAAAKGERP